jgi:dTDP-4-dehydrorhamnose 3,5-epimerase
MDDSQVLIVGANGQVGRACQDQYPGAKAVSGQELDITDAQAVAAFDWSSVKLIINGAGYTNVDGAESPEGRVAAWNTNAVGVANLTRVATEHDAIFIHISSEYVFDGSLSPHQEDEPFSPLSVYGSSKAAGDIVARFAPKHYILRTSWIIGDGKNFVRTMISLGQKGIAPTVVADQIGRLTFAAELARVIDHLVKKSAPYGTYNATNGGEAVSWANVTRAIFAAGNFDLTVTDTTTAEYFADKPAAAKRPLNSTLELRKLEGTGFSAHDWRDDLNQYVNKEISQS